MLIPQIRSSDVSTLATVTLKLETSRDITQNRCMQRRIALRETRYFISGASALGVGIDWDKWSRNKFINSSHFSLRFFCACAIVQTHRISLLSSLSTQSVITFLWSSRYSYWFLLFFLRFLTSLRSIKTILYPKTYGNEGITSGQSRYW